MQPRLLARHVGNLLIIVGLLMFVPAVYALLADEPLMVRAFFTSAAAAVGAGAALRSRAPTDELHIRTALGVVTLGWAAAVLASALPFMLSGAFAHWSDAVFEAASGVTTTGATVMTDIEAHPRSLLLWRSMLQWLGAWASSFCSFPSFPGSASAPFSCFARKCRGRSRRKSYPVCPQRQNCYGLCTRS